MPIRFEVDTTRRRIHTRAEGVVEGADLIAYFQALRAHPDYRGDMDELFDLSGATEIRVSGADVRRFSASTEPVTSRGTPIRVAVVAPGDLEYGLSRMYELLQIESLSTIQIFRKREEAEAWLDAEA